MRAALLGTALLVSACGQKGPLALPGATAAGAAASVPAANHTSPAAAGASR
ncbi:LPS translocon maturation chaperone LptM [Aquabacterium sp. OR-4]|uniref:LPS translocon maturation chaperone LptM n=1 Tax=Aquabacterium sp. OR-4 TaxID=2978127 RepID=UPI0021B34AC3|nr:lipoprotein [Aquabacterium sp. OR-4]MDT7837579.1 lipoprotein [Aquabacterium sp. OR-4]